MKTTKKKNVNPTKKKKYLTGQEYYSKNGHSAIYSKELVWDDRAEHDAALGDTAKKGMLVPAKDHWYIKGRGRLSNGIIKTPEEYFRINGVLSFKPCAALVWDDKLGEVVAAAHPYILNKYEEHKKALAVLNEDPCALKYKQWVLKLCKSIRQHNDRVKRDNRDRPFSNFEQPRILFPMDRIMMSIPETISIDTEIEKWYERECLNDPHHRVVLISNVKEKLSREEAALLGLDRPSSEIEKEFLQRSQPKQ